MESYAPLKHGPNIWCSQWNLSSLYPFCPFGTLSSSILSEIKSQHNHCIYNIYLQIIKSKKASSF